MKRGEIHLALPMNKHGKAFRRRCRPRSSVLAVASAQRGVMSRSMATEGNMRIEALEHQRRRGGCQLEREVEELSGAVHGRGR